MALKHFVAAATLGISAPALAAPGEIVLHIDGKGEVAPDIYTLTQMITAGGDSKAAAEAEMGEVWKATQERIRAAGFDPATAALGPVTTSETPAVCKTHDDCELYADAYAPSLDGTPESAAAAAAGAAMDAAASDCCAPKRKKLSKAERKAREERIARLMKPTWQAVASFDLTIPVADIPKLDASGLVDQDQTYLRMSGNPFGGRGFALKDREAARKTAIERATANARAEADVYAAALGFKVVRIEKVSSATPPFSSQDFMGFITKMAAFGKDSGAALAGETAYIGVDFVIAPK
jgi:uncharacterized protein YggE